MSERFSGRVVSEIPGINVTCDVDLETLPVVMPVTSDGNACSMVTRSVRSLKAHQHLTAVVQSAL
jgi:hypothetical protein